jgi:hypothetical protein
MDTWRNFRFEMHELVSANIPGEDRQLGYVRGRNTTEVNGRLQNVLTVVMREGGNICKVLERNVSKV